MAKIVVEEFDVAHKFAGEIVCFLSPLEKTLEISHVVGSSDFSAYRVKKHYFLNNKVC